MPERSGEQLSRHWRTWLVRTLRSNTAVEIRAKTGKALQYLDESERSFVEQTVEQFVGTVQERAHREAARVMGRWLFTEMLWSGDDVMVDRIKFRRMSELSHELFHHSQIKTLTLKDEKVRSKAADIFTREMEFLRLALELVGSTGTAGGSTQGEATVTTASEQLRRLLYEFVKQVKAEELTPVLTASDHSGAPGGNCP
jgi:hypothetical protein